MVIRIGLVGLLLGSITVFIYCLAFVWRGYSVPASGCGLIFSITGLGVVVVSWMGRKTIEQTARFADREWSLKDVLTSAYHFRVKSQKGDIYQLVQDQADAQVKNLDPKTFSYVVSRKFAGISLFLLIATFWMLTLPPSDAVLAQMEKEEMTADRTEEVQQALEAYLQELEKDLNDDEKEALHTLRMIESCLNRA